MSGFLYLELYQDADDPWRVLNSLPWVPDNYDKTLLTMKQKKDDWDAKVYRGRQMRILCETVDKGVSSLKVVG